MTIRYPDRVLFEGELYILCQINGEGMFDPLDAVASEVASDSSSADGYFCTYGILDNKLYLEMLQPSGIKGQTEGLGRAIPFTGSLLMGTGFMDEVKVHMGVLAPYKYKKVVELVLEDGRVVETIDRSTEMAEIRAELTAASQAGAGDFIANID
jgi:hypothetical protein